MPLCPTKGGLSVRFATLDQNSFEDVGRQGAAAFFSVIAMLAFSPESAITK
jgi:hypothetical protein